MRPSLILPVLAISACTPSPSEYDVVGPFTGPVHRYAVDRFELPLTNPQARAMGDDLNGDGTVDNEIGQTLGFLAQYNDLNLHSADMIAAGALMSSIEIQADDLDNDLEVGVRYLGTPSTPFTIIGGELRDGAFVSNRTATSNVLGAAELVLPVFADADPIHIPAYAMELSYTRAADGGLDIRVAGGVDPVVATSAIFTGIVQMMDAKPRDHVDMMNGFDANHDWFLTMGELMSNSLVQSLLSADVVLQHSRMNSAGNYDEDSVSFGFQVHAIPCDTGSCVTTITDTCSDRVLDGDETDVDCGGSCVACAGMKACSIGADCQAQVCSPSGTCLPPSCADGVLDGFESDLDCGAGCQMKCAQGKSCTVGADCASGNCDHGTCWSN